MVALTAWGWVGLGVGGAAAAAVALVVVGLSWRKRARMALVEHLRRSAPEIAIAAVHQDRIELRFPQRGPEASGTFHLERFYAELTAVSSAGAAARAVVLDTVVQAIREGASGLDDLQPAVARAAVMPRLVGDEVLAQLRAEVAGRGVTLPALPSGVAGISIVLVLDREASVAYLTDDLLVDLALTPEAAVDVARANLARTFDPALVRAAVRSRDLTMVKTYDTFDAARLLLVPGCLEAGESLVALVPDRDTLVLVTPPVDGDWSGLRRLAQTADGTPLCAEPLVVTSAGIARAA